MSSSREHWHLPTLSSDLRGGKHLVDPTKLAYTSTTGRATALITGLSMNLELRFLLVPLNCSMRRSLSMNVLERTILVKALPALVFEHWRRPGTALRRRRRRSQDAEEKPILTKSGIPTSTIDGEPALKRRGSSSLKGSKASPQKSSQPKPDAKVRAHQKEQKIKSRSGLSFTRQNPISNSSGVKNELTHHGTRRL